MNLKLTKKELKSLKLALRLAIDYENSFIDAHTCQFCHGSKIFQDRPCICKTGALKGSIKLIRSTNKLISNFVKLLQRFNETTSS